MFNRNSATQLFLVGIRKLFVDTFKMHDWIYKKFLFVRSTTKRKETDFSMNGIKDVPEVTEGAAITFQDTSSGYEKEWEPRTYGTGLKWTLEADEDELYGYLRKFPKFLDNAVKYTVESIAANVINDSFTDNGPDGVPMFSLLHPSDLGNQANTPTAQVDLGMAALEAALLSLSKQLTHEGLPIDDKEKKTLWVPPDLKAMAKRIVTGDKVPFSSNNTMNYLQDAVNIEVNPYFSSTKAWFVLAKPYDGGPTFVWRKNPYVMTDSDPDTLAKRVRVRMRLDAGGHEWRGSYASSGA